ncbi:MAG: hypothetical protein IT190_07350 [Microbacteriaceae bacterium]|nr:hypothetical protein [Microbacteriaceae bacterium]
MEDAGGNWVDDCLKNMKVRLLTESIAEDDELLKAIEIIVAHRQHAKENNQSVDVTLRIEPAKIEYDTDKRQAKLTGLALPFITVWLLRVRDHSGTPSNTRDALNELMPFHGASSSFTDAEAIIAHLKQAAPFVFGKNLVDFESRCLHCVCNPRSGKSLYCSDECRDKFAKLVKRLASRPAREIESTMIKKLVDCGLGYQL